MSIGHGRPLVTGFPPLRIIIVGLGHRSVKHHIPTILANDLVTLTGVVDDNLELARTIGMRLRVPFASHVDELLQNLAMPPEAALVAVPHSEYLSIVSSLAAARIHVIKEKPYAVSVDEARKLKKIVSSAGISLQVTLQRRFDPVYVNFSRLLSRISRIHAVEARYTMNVERLDEGWRASQLKAGGGALLDLGYHYVDLIVWYLGLPDLVSCQMAAGNRPGQDYDTEDTAFVQFAFKSADLSTNVMGSLVVSRVYPYHDESLQIYGTAGSVGVTRDQCELRSPDGTVLECLSPGGSRSQSLMDQLNTFVLNIRSDSINGTISSSYLEHIAFIDAAYRSAGMGAPASPHDSMHMLEG
nr:Gfo/Idh/MocA family oxidoreductase [Catellatospora citrea]